MIQNLKELFFCIKNYKKLYYKYSESINYEEKVTSFFEGVDNFSEKEITVCATRSGKSGTSAILIEDCD